jgi:dihydroneopterin aldolase
MSRNIPGEGGQQSGQDEDLVFIRDLELTCSIGIHDHEKQTPQRVVINLEMSVEKLDNPLSDNHENVVCYESVANQIRAMVLRGHINLVETMADDIVEICFGYARVFRVMVRVEKPDIMADATSVGIKIIRHRSAP